MDSNDTLKLFLHMPKCGGASVLAAMEKMDDAKLVKDYNSYFKIPANDRQDVIDKDIVEGPSLSEDSIVYGHFFPVKYKRYLENGNYKLVTILRDPIQRLLSHYRFWTTGNFPDHYLWKKMKAQNWKFYDFAYSAEMQNIYAQYFSGIDVNLFSYIGIYEQLNESAKKCMDALELNSSGLELEKVNVTNLFRATNIDIDNPAYKDLKQFHAADYEIYEYAKSLNG